MSAHMSLSVSIAVMGAIATYVSGVFDYYSVWIGFIAWAAFLANNNCMKTTVQSGVMGAVLAAVAFVLMGKLGSAEWVVPVSVGVTVFALVWLTSMPMFTSATTAVYTYAATAGLAIHTSSGGMLANMDASNPLVTVVVSIVLGCVFAMAANKLNDTIS
ncbi:MAG: hypothetical protein CMF40_05565 [Legionellales bacterium]|jgi:hypothetical protein|nr:hypothetical protein [Legionellales bacterium]|tara:strand:+ start:201 stop:677 length:477 start_codon:yes stop_codon:yes gene_type:complete